MLTMIGRFMAHVTDHIPRVNHDEMATVKMQVEMIRPAVETIATTIMTQQGNEATWGYLTARQ